MSGVQRADEKHLLHPVTQTALISEAITRLSALCHLSVQQLRRWHAVLREPGGAAEQEGDTRERHLCVRSHGVGGA